MKSSEEFGLSFELCSEEVTRDRSSALDSLYELYEEMFPLPDEREPKEAFLQILALNEALGVQRDFGPWREFVMALRLWEGGPVVGGHIFGVTTSAAHRGHGYQASVQGIYTFLSPLVRGRRLIPEFSRLFREHALRTFGLERADSQEPIIFFEVNNPLRMSAAEIEVDRAASADPYQRYKYWLNRGFRPLDFKYVQPPLRAGAEPVRYLDLFCSASEESVPAAVILAHLRPFISISVLKAQPAECNNQFLDMREQLGGRAISFKERDHPEVAPVLARTELQP